MIVVAEGPSAAGKSTWSRRHGPDRVIAEAGQLGACVSPVLDEVGRVEPPRGASDEEAAEYWVEVNAARWAMALAAEAQGPMVVCDTDPLKLHYDYCLAVVGVQDWARFDVGIERNVDAIRGRRLGLADLFCVHIPSEDVLARQAHLDATRRRSRFALHRRLGPALRTWYRVLDEVDPGRVLWEFPDVVPRVAARADRYDAELFLRWMDALPRSA